MMYIKKALLHIFAWIAGFAGAYYAMHHSEVRVNYGLITGWWLAFYVGYIVDVRIGVTPLVFILYFVTTIFKLNETCHFFIFLFTLKSFHFSKFWIFREFWNIC